MFLTKFLKGIGHFFSDLFNAAKKAYDHLPEDQKAAILHGAGIVDIFNSMLDSSAAEVRKAIQDKFPDLDESKLETGLFGLAHSFNLATDVSNLDDAITKIQGYLKGLEGKQWAGMSNAAANVVSIFISPPEMKVAAIVSLTEYVYQTFIKKAA